jgi:hypothetical protein
MIGSEFSRILCHKVGIFDIRQEAAIHGLLDALVTGRGLDTEAAIEYCAERWEEYKRSARNLSWTWGSAYRFFGSGLWDTPEAWPWRPEVLNSGASLGVNKDAANVELLPEEQERLRLSAQTAQDNWDRRMGKTIQ